MEPARSTAGLLGSNAVTSTHPGVEACTSGYRATGLPGYRAAGPSGYRATTNPTIGPFSLSDAAEPKNLASPKLKTPPSVATSQ